MKKISGIRILKNISYIILPIMLVCLILTIISNIYVSQYGKDKFESENYFESEIFYDAIEEDIDLAVSQYKYLYDNNDDIETSYYTEDYIATYKGEEYEVYIDNRDCEILIINQTDKNIYISFDNVYSNFFEYDSMMYNIEGIIGEISTRKYNFIYENEEIDTSIGGLEKDIILDTSLLKMLKEEQYIVYMGIDENLENQPSYIYSKVAYEILGTQFKNQNLWLNIGIALSMIIISIILIIKGIGKKGKVDGISLNIIDKIPVEIITIIILVIEYIIMLIIQGLTYELQYVTISVYDLIITIGLVAIVMYIFGIIYFETVVKRIKSKSFWKSTLIYIIFNKIRNIFVNFKERPQALILGICIFPVIIGLVIFSYISPVLTVLSAIGITCVYLSIIIKKYKDIHVLRKLVDDISENKKIDIDTSKFSGEINEYANKLIEISKGFSIAIDEQVKSERTKTELIANVSHDIKTPLTSIINYVDLLKKENIQNERCKEYLEILDQKSFRLKKLTDDLIEISKASSGNIEIKLEKLDIAEFIYQITGEFEEKFKQENLSINLNISSEKVEVIADGRYMYRIFENIYSNIYKYALNGTRVYIDIFEGDSKVTIEAKNISKTKLQKDSKELVERFTREDNSRTTEGSGLGLAIVKNLVELQNGKFDVILDGDLFKARIVLDK